MKKLDSLALRAEGHRLFVLDQTLLPHEEKWIECREPRDMIELIQRLAVRGAPLIGVAAALSLAQAAEKGASPEELIVAADQLREARPTAVNLAAAIDRLKLSLKPFDRARLVSEAEAIFLEDVALCEAMADKGASLIADGDQILTHCNTGGLATAGVGTALGAIRRAYEQGKKIHVFVDETRPLLQGARLTAWELAKLGIPHTLICDNMAGALMAQGRVQKVFVGADRIAQNGDAANKIGTYGLAVLAHHHGVKFYVVAPQTTFDESCANGSAIPIEERKSEEVSGRQANASSAVWNPAFDVTPRKLITAIVSDSRIF
jgi:methylthioribose-1-phosphate isomerase